MSYQSHTLPSPRGAAEQAEDEILIAVRAVAPEIDEMIRAEPLPEGWLPGWDVAGVVLKAAPEGFSPQPGDRVVGVATGAEWGSYMTLPSEYAVVLPDHVSFEQAAALRVAVLTALRLVRGAGSVAGRRVLVTGAGRGIGRLLVELAAALGAEVTAVVRDAGEAAETARLGARQVVTADAVPGAFEGSFDVVYEAAAGDLIAAGRGLTADGATVFLYESFAPHGADIGFFRFFGGPEQAGLRHFVFRTATPEDRELAQLLDLLTTGELSLGRPAAALDRRISA
ncbi:MULTISPECIES: zinc-binding dehydrogenase [Streptomyces]|uniref:zinc-binding dehydrogenase n=1 Tax=Streptomyces TaxID=1883 RepID=UPI000F79B4E9|nr:MULTISPECIES: zinc-binding dehydrogenase [Streptomyces]RST05676.1 alcohol dehydrogenase [Streptomyces sp. WAC07149]GLX22945.1 oxidoreductase [Streptomyces lavendulae subsp. lavendulae]GLX30225.1 oxidoreductase [Streptomyces lavendulae subsp. lavendulae]